MGKLRQLLKQAVCSQVVGKPRCQAAGSYLINRIFPKPRPLKSKWFALLLLNRRVNSLNRPARGDGRGPVCASRSPGWVELRESVSFWRISITLMNILLAILPKIPQAPSL